MKNISDEIVNSLSLNLREKIKKLPKSNLNIEEIRLRSQKPLILNANNKDYFYNEKENDLYPYSHSIVLAWERGLLYIPPNAFCKAYG